MNYANQTMVLIFFLLQSVHVWAFFSNAHLTKRAKLLQLILYGEFVELCPNIIGTLNALKASRIFYWPSMLLPKKSVHLMFLTGTVCCLAQNKIAQGHFCWLGCYWTHMSLCRNSPLQTGVLLTHQFAMVIPNVCADLLQPVQGGVLKRRTAPCIVKPNWVWLKNHLSTQIQYRFR